MLPSPYQVGLSIDGNHLISEHVAKAVSRQLGGNGEVWLEDSADDWRLWSISLPEPYDGTVNVKDESGFVREVTVETPMP